MNKAALPDVLNQLRQRTTYQLKSLAKTLGLQGFSDLNKDDLIVLIIGGCEESTLRDHLRISWWDRNRVLIIKLGVMGSVASIIGVAIAFYTLRDSAAVEAAVGQRLARIDAVRAKLQDELDKEKQRNSQLAGGVRGVRVAADWADSLAHSDPAVVDLAKMLGELIEDFETEFSTEELSEADDLRFRLARATQANAERRFHVTLELVTADDAKTEREATEAQIDREVRTNQVRGDAFYGLRRWQQALVLCHRLSSG